MLDRINNLRLMDFDKNAYNISKSKNNNLFDFDIKENFRNKFKGYVRNILTDEDTIQEFIGYNSSENPEPVRLEEADCVDYIRDNFVLTEDDYANQNVTEDDLNGIIDNSRQSIITGDCWLLADLNSLSYSKKGAQAIKDAMTFDDDGSIAINFKGVGISYTVSASELATANNDISYSYGDDDVLAFELAIEKLRNDIASDKIGFYSDIPYFVNDAVLGTESIKSIEGGHAGQVYYLLTGKLIEPPTMDPSQIEEYLDDFQNNPDTAAMSCHFVENDEDSICTILRNASGEDIFIFSSHGYSVKSVDDNTVTIVNTWDSTQEIILSRDTFSKLANVSYCDLSDERIDYSGVFQF